MAKIYSIRQEVNASPSAYLERLMEAFRAYSPMDPEAAKHRSAVVLGFVSQAAPDIRKKLQKTDGLAGRSINDLEEVANKVYNNGETPEERKAGLRIEEPEWLQTEIRLTTWFK